MNHFLKNKIYKGNFSIVMLLSGIMLLGAILRTVDLSSKSFWGDELLSLFHSQDIHNIKSFFSSLWGNFHPPLYFLLLKFWSVFGNSEFHLRLLSVIFGVAVIPATYLLGIQLFEKKVSLLGAFFVAVSPFHLLYDREVRMYGLLTLLSILSLYFFLRALREGKNKLWVVYTVLTVLNTYTHYHAFLVIIFQWIFFLLRFKCYKNQLKKMAISQLAIALCFAFWLPVFLTQLRAPSLDSSDRIPFVFFEYIIKPLYVFFSFSFGQTILPWNLLVIPGVLIVLTAFILGVKKLILHQEARDFVLLYLFIPLIAGTAMSLAMPRYYIFISPVYLLLLAFGLFCFSNRVIRLGIILALLFILAVPLKNYYLNNEFHILAHVDPFREVGEYLKTNVKEGDLFVNIGGSYSIRYYSNNITESGLNFKEALAQKKYNRIWILIADTKFKDEGENAVKWLDEHYKRILEKKYYRDPDYAMKKRLFRKNFLEYRIKVYLYIPKTV